MMMMLGCPRSSGGGLDGTLGREERRLGFLADDTRGAVAICTLEGQMSKEGFIETSRENIRLLPTVLRCRETAR